MGAMNPQAQDAVVLDRVQLELVGCVYLEFSMYCSLTAGGFQ